MLAIKKSLRSGGIFYFELNHFRISATGRLIFTSCHEFDSGKSLNITSSALGYNIFFCSSSATCNNNQNEVANVALKSYSSFSCFIFL